MLTNAQFFAQQKFVITVMMFAKMSSACCFRTRVRSTKDNSIPLH